jgi:ribosomal protein S18 acetylase RimI-like enzyme
MSEPLEIRPAVLDDSPRLAELCGVLGYPAESKEFAIRLGRVLPRSEHIVLVAEIGPGRLAGWIHSAEHEFLECGQQCEILGLVVAAEHRGQAVGRRLVTAVEAWARQRGLEDLTVRSNVTRLESHPFYRRLGFTRVKTQHVYRKRPRASRSEEREDV